MVLHGHPINEQRQSVGKPAINSIWLWGGGVMPVLGNPAYASVWSNNPLATGLAMASDTPTQPCPNNLAELLEQTTGHGHDLVILDDLLPRYFMKMALAGALPHKHWTTTGSYHCGLRWAAALTPCVSSLQPFTASSSGRCKAKIAGNSGASHARFPRLPNSWLKERP
jgi:hypothetical protein